MEDARSQKINAHIEKDPFVRKMGAQVEILSPGHSRVSLAVTEEMVNFHGSTHGGVIFALGDMAFAAASNSHGQTAVALNVGITFLKASSAGDHLVAEAVETSQSGPIALYDIVITNAQTGEKIAKSQNVVYRKKDWFVPR